MTTPNTQVRRATIDDLEKLTALWQQENLPVAELDKRFKEFQLAEDDKGNVLGAMGLEIQGTEGRLFAEAFAHPEQADELREMLRSRFEMQAKNHGLVRMWTQLHAPFWHNSGFQTPSDADQAKLPPGFAGSPQPWLMIQLREEPPSMPALDKEFQMFKEAEREQTQKMMQQARVLKMVAGVISVIVFLLVLTWAFFFLRLQSQSGQ